MAGKSPAGKPLKSLTAAPGLTQIRYGMSCKLITKSRNIGNK